MEYDEDTADLVIKMVAGGMTLEKLESVGIVDRLDFLRWRRMLPDVDGRYAQALHDRQALQFDRVHDIWSALLDPDDDTCKRRIPQLKMAIDISLKMMADSAKAVTALMGSAENVDTETPRVIVEFVKSNGNGPTSGKT